MFGIYIWLGLDLGWADVATGFQSFESAEQFALDDANLFGSIYKICS